MKLSAQVDQDRLRGGAERRQHPRYKVRINAVLTIGDESQAVVLNDLSAGGAGLTGVVGLDVEQPITLEFQCGRRLEGHVGWHMAGMCGVRFVEPLSSDDQMLRDAIAATEG